MIEGWKKVPRTHSRVNTSTCITHELLYETIIFFQSKISPSSIDGAELTFPVENLGLCIVSITLLSFAIALHKTRFVTVYMMQQCRHH